MAMFEASGESVKKFMGQYQGLRNFKEKAKEKAEEVTGIVIGAGLTVGMAFAAAYGQGRYSSIDPITGKPDDKDKFHVATVPVDLLLGAAGVIGALTGMLGKYDSLGASAGSGLLAGNLAVSGYRMGREAKATDENNTITEVFEVQATAGYPRMSARGVPSGMSAADRAVMNAVAGSNSR